MCVPSGCTKAFTLLAVLSGELILHPYPSSSLTKPHTHILSQTRKGKGRRFAEFTSTKLPRVDDRSSLDVRSRVA